MTFDEIYARELKKIKQDPVSFVWNNCIKKHDDQEFMVITETAPKIGLVAHFNLGLVAHINFGLSARFNFGLIA